MGHVMTGISDHTALPFFCVGLEDAEMMCSVRYQVPHRPLLGILLGHVSALRLHPPHQSSGLGKGVVSLIRQLWLVSTGQPINGQHDWVFSSLFSP